MSKTNDTSKLASRDRELRDDELDGVTGGSLAHDVTAAVKVISEGASLVARVGSAFTNGFLVMTLGANPGRAAATSHQSGGKQGHCVPAKAWSRRSLTPAPARGACGSESHPD